VDNQQRSLTVYNKHPVYGLEINQDGTSILYGSKIKKQHINAQGYYIIYLTYRGKPMTLKVHRLVAECWLEPPCKVLLEKTSREHWKKPLVKHLDNNKLNNHYKNLEWCDLKSNTQQAWSDDLIPSLKGESNGRAILTDNIVHEVCKYFQEGGQPLSSTRIFNISMQQATKIRAGIAWKHISSQYDIKVNRRKKRPTTSREA
jgi:hypothetical protein